MVEFQWPIRRGKKKDNEVFHVKTRMERLGEEGLRQVIKSDVTEARVQELKESLPKVLGKLNKAKTDEEKAEAVDDAVTLVFVGAVPWLRSMQNDWLADKISDFIEQYREGRDIPSFMKTLVAEAKFLINLAFTNIDVEPFPPIIIWGGPQRVSVAKESKEIE